MMRKTVLGTAILAAFCLAAPASADEIADLKAELAAQRKAAQEQQARMDALERRLNGMQTAPAVASGTAGTAGGTATPPGAAPSSPRVAANDQAAPATAAPPSGLNYTHGEGLSVSGAQGSLSLYGLIDVSYVHLDHANAGGSTLTTPRVAWFSGNRWGLTGSRNMGDSGVNVIFRLESEYESQTGSMDTPGVLFNRDAWVGVQNTQIGKITFGRQNAIGRDPASSAIYGDPYGPAAPSLEEGGYTNNNNFKQLIFYAGSATGTRLDNGVVWKKAFDNGLLAAAEYQFGGIAGDFSNGSTESVSLAYAGKFFNLAGFATNAKVAGLTDRSYSVGGNYLLGTMWRVNAGYFHYTGEQAAALGSRHDNAYTVSAKFAPTSTMDYELGYQDMRASNAAVNGGGNVLNAFANASAATATATGSRSTLYGSAFYHFDKITEVYVAADYLRLKGGYKVGSVNGFGNQKEYAVGLRTRF